MNLLLGIMIGAYLVIGTWLSVANYKSNQLKIDMIEDLLKQNELIAEQNRLLRGIIKKYGLDIKI